MACVTMCPRPLKVGGSIEVPERGPFGAPQIFATGLVSGTGDVFRRFFLPPERSKFEWSVGRVRIGWYQSVESLQTDVLFGIMGGESSEMTLSQVSYLLQKQRNGTPGSLAVDVVPNFFFVRDAYQKTRVVRASFFDRGWFLTAEPIEGSCWAVEERQNQPKRVPVGSRVFFPHVSGPLSA